ncbi:MAG: CehA/McbA family metallohydrolase [Gemmataceae bacterium]|nr:CehA/McbA family metallohydrolase [Gemmataceae bacterium]
MISANPLRARRLVLAGVCLAMLAACAVLSATSQEGAVKLRLRLIDAATGRDCTGIVRLLDKDQRATPLPGLYDRLRGLKTAPEYAGWHVVPAKVATTSVARGKYQLEAVAGLESQLVRLDLDLTKDATDMEVRLPPAFEPGKHGFVAGNTHLHLMKLTKDDAEDYLRQIPAADRLRVLFISYLERFKDDAEYITNRYPIGDLPAFNATGVLVNNGEEHRHNFKGYGEGYGHVMFLNIKDLVKPVSLGPGITGGGNDDRPLRPGIDAARKQGGTVIWCHNSFGYEDVLNALSGRLHALNVFDGSRRGSFEESYYRYLNVGVRMPLSTGTDWFIYDFARVYVRGAEPLTIAGWLDGLKAGRNQATNGPLLTLRVGGHDCGDTIELAQPAKLKIEAAGVGRHDFQELQLVHNGKVIGRQRTAGKAPYQVKMTEEVRVEEPGWFALRIESTTKNELGYQLFAHTSPVYVRLGGKDILDLSAAAALLKQIEEGQGAIQKQALFSDAESGQRLLALYTDAAKELRARMNRNSR